MIDLSAVAFPAPTVVTSETNPAGDGGDRSRFEVGTPLIRAPDRAWEVCDHVWDSWLCRAPTRPGVAAGRFGSSRVSGL